MGLEVASYIADLVSTNPLSSDAVGQGDDHLRLLKTTLQATFPNFGNRHARVISGATGYTVLSSDNSAVIEIPLATGATITHTFSLPALSSITAGFYLEIFAKGPSDVGLIVPTGGASIEGAATFSVGPKVTTRVYYDGTTWRCINAPVFGFNDGNLSLPVGLTVAGATQLNGTVTISGAATLHGTLSVSGAAHFKGNASIGGNAVVLGTFGVTGAGQFNSTLTVSGAAHLQSSVSIAGVVSTNVNVHVGTTLTVSGAARFVSVVSIAGATHMNTTLSVGGATTLGSTLTVAGAAHFNSSATISGLSMFIGGATFLSTVSISGTLEMVSGKIKFPATQSASADANTLDDYEEGTWTPTLTFATPGNLAVTYNARGGQYQKVGDQVQLTLGLTTTAFTHTTASGNVLVTGIPFTPDVTVSGGITAGSVVWGGITKASYTQVCWIPVNGSTSTQMIASGSGVAESNVTAANMPTGGNVTFFGQVFFNT